MIKLLYINKYRGKMKKFKLILLILLSINIYANETNFDNIIKTAKEQNKQIMVFFHMEHCPWCHKFINESLSDKKIQNMINKDFIFVSLDVETEGTITYQNKKMDKRDFARKYEVYFYPTTLIFNNMEIVYRIRGYRNKPKFINIINYTANKAYKSMTLKEFIVNQEFNK
jgi:thioredoxin-related protein